MQGLEWVLDMYYTGSCPDYRFAYDRQPPSITELMVYLKSSVRKSKASPAAVPAKQKASLVDPFHIMAANYTSENVLGKPWHM